MFDVSPEGPGGAVKIQPVLFPPLVELFPAYHVVAGEASEKLTER